MGAGESVVKAESSTQTEPTEGNSEYRRHKTSLGVKDYPKELLDYTPGKKYMFSICLFQRLMFITISFFTFMPDLGDLIFEFCNHRLFSFDAQ